MPIEIICENCKKPFFVKPSKAKRSKFCSRKCYIEGKPKRTIPDIIDKKFGKLTAIRKLDGYRWLCICDCGNEHIVKQSHLKDGNVQSCGCHRQRVGKRMIKENRLCKTIKIEPGTKFGRWTVIKFDETRNRYSYHICQCDCGTIRSVMSRNLIKKLSKSCGCNLDEIRPQIAKKNFTKHGLCKETWYINFLQRRRRRTDRNWTLEMNDLLFKIQPVCVICQSSNDLAVDHVIPFSKGGKLEPGNVVVLCRSCNSIKNNRDLNDLPIGWQQFIKTATNQYLNAWNSYTTGIQMPHSLS